MKLDEAILHQWAFKPDPMRAMLARVLRLALGGGEFSANDLPVHGQDAHGGSGIAGAVILQLIRDEIVSAVGVWDGGEFVQRTVHNAGGNKIGIYRLSKPGLARTLLDRHAPTGAKISQLNLI